MKLEEINMVVSLAQAALALGSLIASIALSLIVYKGTERIAKIEYDRSIRDWWNTLDRLALSSDEMLLIADEVMNPAASHESIDQKRRKWFAFVVLNALASSYIGIEMGLTRSTSDSIEIMRHHLQRLMTAEDIYQLSQEGYEAGFAALCRNVRTELDKKGPLHHKPKNMLGSESHSNS